MAVRNAVASTEQGVVPPEATPRKLLSSWTCFIQVSVHSAVTEHELEDARQGSEALGSLAGHTCELNAAESGCWGNQPARQTAYAL